MAYNLEASKLYTEHFNDTVEQILYQVFGNDLEGANATSKPAVMKSIIYEQADILEYKDPVKYIIDWIRGTVVSAAPRVIEQPALTVVSAKEKAVSNNSLLDKFADIPKAPPELGDRYPSLSDTLDACFPGAVRPTATERKSINAYAFHIDYDKDTTIKVGYALAVFFNQDWRWQASGAEDPKQTGLVDRHVKSMKTICTRFIENNNLMFMELSPEQQTALLHALGQFKSWMIERDKRENRAVA
jgi:hypothetical protein